MLLIKGTSPSYAIFNTFSIEMHYYLVHSDTYEGCRGKFLMSVIAKRVRLTFLPYLRF